MSERYLIDIRRTFAAPPERVFDAFRDPELLGRWAAPGEHRTERVDMDFEVGGRYRREMRFPDGSLHVLTGEYLEIDAPRRLVYTYVWESIPGAPETKVEIELEGASGATELHLVHSGLSPGEMAYDHRAGWEACFDQLETLLEGSS